MAVLFLEDRKCPFTKGKGEIKVNRTQWVNYYEYCERSTAGKTFIIAFEELQLYQNGNEITKRLDA